MKLRVLPFFTAAILLAVSHFSIAENTIDISFDIPLINEDPYFRPYVAIWLEDEAHQPKDTLALWYQVDPNDLSSKKSRKGKKWLKDLRQWWRHVGKAAKKADVSFDAVTAATRKPGSYKVVWDYPHLPAGAYYLNIEAAREDGGRNVQRILVQLGEAAEYRVAAEGELGDIRVVID